MGMLGEGLSRQHEACIRRHKGRGFALLILIVVGLGCATTDNNSAARVNRDKKAGPLPADEYVKPLGNGWVEAVGRAGISNITPEEARRKAIMNACTAAIQYYGIQVSQRGLDVQAESNHKLVQDDFLSLTSLTTNGVILEKLVMEERVISEGDGLQKYIKLRVKIGRQTGGKDPYFSVKAALNRDVFKVNDTLKVAVTSTQDCYLTILGISDDVVNILFPNQYCADNFLAKGRRFEFPNESHTKMGMTIPALLPQGMDKDMGVIKILATKAATSLEGLSRPSEYGPSELALQDLLNLLIKIPLNEMEEVDLPYVITR